MLNNQYPISKERILTGEAKRYFFISADKSKITYKSAAKTYSLESEKEKQRAYFFVELIEKYGYKETDIQLDEEITINKTPRVFDLVIYDSLIPIFGINFKQGEPSVKTFFDLQDNAKPISDLPVKNH